MFDLEFHLSIFIYILALFSGIYGIIFLKKKSALYTVGFLKDLYKYYILINSLIFLYFIFQYAQTNISLLFSLDRDFLAKKIYHVFYIPLSIGAVIFFLSFGLNLVIQSIQKRVLRGIQLTITIATILFILVKNLVFKEPFSKINLSIDYLKNYSHIVISLAIIVFIFFQKKREIQKQVLYIVSSYWLTFILLTANNLLFFREVIPHSLFTLINPLVFILLNTLPIIYVRNYLVFSDIPVLSKVESREIVLQKIAKKHKLSKREIEVLDLMSQTKTNDEIAEILFISVKTVKNHIHHIYKKTGVKSRIQIINLVLNFEID